MVDKDAALRYKFLLGTFSIYQIVLEIVELFQLEDVNDDLLIVRDII